MAIKFCYAPAGNLASQPINGSTTDFDLKRFCAHDRSLGLSLFDVHTIVLFFIFKMLQLWLKSGNFLRNV